MIRTVPLDENAADTITGIIPFAGPPNVFYYEGEHYRHVWRRFRAYVKRSGVCPFRFHDRWHWHGVDHLRRSGWIYELSQILGHRRVKTTEIYLQLLTPEETKASKAGTSPARAADDQTEKQHQAKEELNAKPKNIARRSLRLQRSALTRGGCVPCPTQDPIGRRPPRTCGQ